MGILWDGAKQTVLSNVGIFKVLILTMPDMPKWCASEWTFEAPGWKTDHCQWRITGSRDTQLEVNCYREKDHPLFCLYKAFTMSIITLAPWKPRLAFLLSATKRYQMLNSNFVFFRWIIQSDEIWHTKVVYQFPLPIGHNSSLSTSALWQKNS